ncbi:sigma-70 family RNA polymerase sigma factor [bacterium]|jgi:RNA polymerase sigma factor (sigma-70 family)|nr:sigma-70 family RNA polymerase sigma factor [bacterium]
MEFIMKYEKLVCKIASKYSCYSNFEDLKQVGMIGLLKAVDKYIPNPQTKFSTYATFWIRGEILEYLRNDKNIKPSKEILALSKKVEICRERLKDKFNREPSVSEIATILEEDEKNVLDAIYAKEFVLSTDYIINQDEEGKDTSLYDTIPYYEMGYDEDILALHFELDKLSEEEKKIIDLRYYQDMTQSEVSKVLGTNQVNVSRCESKILQKLKKEMAA